MTGAAPLGSQTVTGEPIAWQQQRTHAFSSAAAHAPSLPGGAAAG
jgi:hypothetical protein